MRASCKLGRLYSGQLTGVLGLPRSFRACKKEQELRFFSLLEFGVTLNTRVCVLSERRTDSWVLVANARPKLTCKLGQLSRQISLTRRQFASWIWAVDCSAARRAARRGVWDGARRKDWNAKFGFVWLPREKTSNNLQIEFDLLVPQAPICLYLQLKSDDLG